MHRFMPLSVITNPEELLALRAEWEALWRRTPDATPFQSPMWLLPWWRQFGVGELHAIVAREGDQLSAIAPLMILREDDESLGMLLGSGNSDYVDAIAPRALVPEIVTQMTQLDCQMWDLQQLRPSSALVDAPLPDGWSDMVSDHDVCPILPIEGAGNDLENLISTHFRKKIRYYRRSLERVEAATPENLDALMSALFDLHAARWKRKGMPGMLADEGDQRFHREVARAMLDAGALRLYATYLEDRIVGVFYGFADRDTVYYYLSGYEPELEKRSIGTVMVAHAIEQAVRVGKKTFDFLRGAEEYKYAWGAKDRMNRRRVLSRG
jgi:CelD/BcsL family acetyltransferase involved in cellulose biosynthesis